ncbi:hypothetical protein M501DRAFT_993484 [Patellaria atrata CBS 101060]|uniref:Uncharacterized protein n=1 Tax=Patellaria atrata CBS 101060 TaxID=1346257 RepID=A0A9P4SGZ7_9PEZI|nr:hypothetical protein M501DRAFT_993484 [Patellaria atrata CBS 101060]
MQQDELANIFARNLTLSSIPPPADPVAQRDPITAPQSEEKPQAIVYASTHYTHSYHLAPKAASEPSSTTIPREDLVAIFLRNNIDPSLLVPSQINLFQNADDDQRLRLLELWRISPPSYGNHALAQELSTTWQVTSLEQEEELARLRYERKMEDDRSNILAHHQHQMDGIMEDVPELTSRPSTTSPVLGQRERERERRNSVEPYMVSGYEALARRDYANQANTLRESTRHNTATDPVYKNTGLWEKPDMSSMENQYGAFAAMRDGYGGFQDNDDVMMM